MHAAALFARHPLRTPRAFNAMLGALGRGQQWVTLLALFDRMQAEGVPPDPKALNLAILAADQVDERRAAALSESLAELRGVARPGAAERAQLADMRAARKGAALEASKKGHAERRRAAGGVRLAKPKPVKLPPPADFAPAERAPLAPAAEGAEASKKAVDKSLVDFLGGDRRTEWLNKALKKK